MDVSTIIIENFLDNPDLVRENVLNIPFNRTGTFPGYRSERADDSYVNYTKNKIEACLQNKIKEFCQDSHCFQLCLDSAETWIHSDGTDWAGVLYLTPNAPVESGTAIYRQQYKENSDITDINNFEIITTIGNVYNRLVLYRGNLFHRSMLSGFGKVKESGRLTQVFFFNVNK